MAFILTRIKVPDYDGWKSSFDKDVPGVRSEATGWRVLRSIDDPNEVHVLVEFDSADRAQEGVQKLLGSGVLDRFEDKSTRAVEVADSSGY